MAAELGSPNAQSYFDQVRKRAYTEDDGTTLSGNYSQQTATKENILKERKLEFAFEGIRYWDQPVRAWSRQPRRLPVPGK